MFATRPKKQLDSKRLRNSLHVNLLKWVSSSKYCLKNVDYYGCVQSVTRVDNHATLIDTVMSSISL